MNSARNRSWGSVPIISLFSGCGSFDHGFQKAGFRVVLAVDVDPVAVKSYNHNRRAKVAQVANLARVDGEMMLSMVKDAEEDVVPRGVIGGAPCQTFSHSNVSTSRRDGRHGLPRRYAEILRALNDAYNLDFFVFENVQGITSRKHQRVFREFKKLFMSAGFTLYEGVLDAVNFGVPQLRPRVFVVGLNTKKYGKLPFVFPSVITSKPKTVRDAFRGLPEPALFRRDIKPAEIPYHHNHWAMMPKSKKFRGCRLKQGQMKGRSFRVLAWDKPSWTVAYGNREVHVHPSGKRRLSVFEAMCLQGLPKNYRLMGNLSDQIRQISDAVPPQLGKALGRAIYEVLDQQKDQGPRARCKPTA